MRIGELFVRIFQRKIANSTAAREENQVVSVQTSPTVVTSTAVSHPTMIWRHLSVCICAYKKTIRRGLAICANGHMQMCMKKTWKSGCIDREKVRCG